MSRFGDQDVNFLDLNNTEIVDEAEMLSFMRIDYRASKFFLQSSKYPGEWVRRRLKYFWTTHDVSVPKDANEYLKWVTKGAVSLIHHYQHNILQVKQVVTEMKAGGKFRYPTLLVPITRGTGDLEDLLQLSGSEILGSTWTLLEMFQMTEVLIDDLKGQLLFQWLEIAALGPRPEEAADNELAAQMSGLSFQSPPTPAGIDELTSALMNTVISQQTDEEQL
ncbi:hypothetical protein MMC13_008136 [Lambiella insularis]|nr:hypothetical protein [Lambiella insularis]